MSEATFDNLLVEMKRAAGILRDEGVPFILAGSLAVYARGGPESDHDVDFILLPDDAERALDILGRNGFRGERPPEGWLFKVYGENDAMIDLIFRPNNQPPDVVRGIVDRADELEVFAISMRVMSTTDVLASKLLALKEHELNYDPPLEIARACREQIDWGVLAERTSESPFAKAFITLAQELGLTG